MEHYSQFDMPSVEERKKSLLNYANSLTNKNYTELELYAIITQIVSETANYSYTGYGVYGRKEEETKLFNILNNVNNVNNVNTFK